MLKRVVGTGVKKCYQPARRGFANARMVRNFDVTLFETSQMEVPTLLVVSFLFCQDAVERSARVYANSKLALWDRLIARSRAILPEMSGDELSKILHAFHVGGVHDESFLQDIHEELEEGITFRGPNDYAVFAHALALHKNHINMELRGKFCRWLLSKCVDEKNVTIIASDLCCLLRGVRNLLSDSSHTEEPLPVINVDVFRCALKFATPNEIVDLCIESCHWKVHDAVDICLDTLTSRNYCVKTLHAKDIVRLFCALASNKMTACFTHGTVPIAVKRVASSIAFLQMEETFQFLLAVSSFNLSEDQEKDLLPIFMRLSKRVKGLSEIQVDRLSVITKHFTTARLLQNSLAQCIDARNNVQVA